MNSDVEWDDLRNIDLRDEDIDYLHPNGKPATRAAEPPDELFSHKPDLRDYERALEEADGHSMKKEDPFLHGDKGAAESI